MTDHSNKQPAQDGNPNNTAFSTDDSANTFSSNAINDAAVRLAEALKGSDYTTVNRVLSQVRAMAYPPLSEDEERAQARVTEALAAQRSVALLRTEARLYSDQAKRTERLVSRLEQAQVHPQVIGEIEQEQAQQQALAAKAKQMELKKVDEFVICRRKAHTQVANLMLQEERQYRSEFQKALETKGGTAAAEQVYQVIRKWNAKTPSAKSSTQYVPDDHNPTTPEYLAWLRQQAQRTITETRSSKDDNDNGSSLSFVQLANQLAMQCSGTATVAPLKSHERTVEKAQDKYHGDFSKVLDLVRGMCVFTSIVDLAQALAVLDEYDQQGQVCIVRAKDRVSTHYDASQFAGGYRDVLLNMQMPISNGATNAHIIAELQLNLATFLKIKNDRGHVNYESARTIHMFNSAFTRRSFLWEVDTDPAEIDELLQDIQLGIVTHLNLDHSRALWSLEAQERLCRAFQDQRCAVREISLRSCRCGDNFILQCLSEDYLQSMPTLNELPPIVSTIRLGSQIHRRTAGRVTSKGIAALLQYFNNSLRVLDLEGCLDMDWYENCAQDVVNAIVAHVDTTVQAGGVPLPQFQELNLKATGLTEAGRQTLETLKEKGKLPPHFRLMHDEDLSGPPKYVGPVMSMES